jgi:MFS family permease
VDSGPGKLLGSLAERDFRNLYTARAFSLLGDGIVPVALAFGVLETRNSPIALGLVLACRSVGQVAFLLLGGVVADRVPRRLLMISADLLRFVVQALIAVLLVTRTAQVWQLAVLSLVYGLGNAFFLPTSTGLIPQVVSAGRLQQANALISMTQYLCTIFGPILASVIIVTSNAGWAFAVDAATFLISAFFVGRLPVITVARTATQLRTEFLAGWREFRSRRWLLIDGVFSALASFAVLAPFLTLGPVVAERSLGGAPAWAAIIAAFGAGSVVGGVGLLRFSPARPLVAAVAPLLLLVLPTLLLAIPAQTVLIALAAFAGGSGLAFFNTLFETTVQMVVPRELLSRVASIDWMMSASLMPLGSALAGPVSESIGTRGVFVFSAAWILLSTGFVLSRAEIRGFRREEVDSAHGVVSAVSSNADPVTGEELGKA